MNIEFKKAVICSFFGFVTLLFMLGLVPSLAHLVYKRRETLRLRLLIPISTALITALVFVLPVGVTDLLLALAGVIIMVWYFIRRKA